MRIVRGVFICLCLAGRSPAAAAAQRSLVIQQFVADVEVGGDGAIAVTETIQPRFTGTWNGLYRTIPVEYRTPQGFSYKLDLDVEVDHGRERDGRCGMNRAVNATTAS